MIIGGVVYFIKGNHRLDPGLERLGRDGFLGMSLPELLCVVGAVGGAREDGGLVGGVLHA